MVNFGPLVAEIGLPVWGTPEGATYVRQGGHHVGHWPIGPRSSLFVIGDNSPVTGLTYK